MKILSNNDFYIYIPWTELKFYIAKNFQFYGKLFLIITSSQFNKMNQDKKRRNDSCIGAQGIKLNYKVKLF